MFKVMRTSLLELASKSISLSLVIKKTHFPVFKVENFNSDN